jgi:hypothetical protein
MALTPIEVESRLAILGNDLSTGVEEYGRLSEQEAQAVSKYDIEHAKLYYRYKIELEEDAKKYSFKITKDDIEAKTLVDLELLYMEMNLKSALVKAKDKHLKSIESKIDSYRSILSFMKEELTRTR